MKKALWLAIGLLFISACDVKTDYDHQVDFSKFKTYSWIKVQVENPLWDDRIMQAVDTQLAARGWQKVPSGGDAAIAAYGSTQNQQSMQTWYNGFGGGWYWGGFGNTGLTTTTVRNTPVGTLMVDIFDVSNKRLIWRATANKTLSDNPQNNVKNLNNVAKNMFKKFPPKSKG